MGVMSCDRLGCENIMCDSYSSEYGYICSDCFNELVGFGLNVNIREFMNTEKTNRLPKYDTREMLDSIFPYNENILMDL